MSPAPLLEIENLAIRFTSDSGVVRAVDGVSLTVAEGETVCVVGESGCGKTVTALSILRLLSETHASSRGESSGAGAICSRSRIARCAP